MKGAALFLAAGLAAAPATADTVVSMFGGEHDDYERIGAHVRLAPIWANGWKRWQVAVHPEFELSRFRHTGAGGGPSTLDQAGAIALFRMVRGEGRSRPYVEAGIGVALFDRTDLGNKEFSTSLQFSQHLGLGAELGGRVSVGWRFSHYSNGDIETPNNGIDLHQVLVGLHF